MKINNILIQPVITEKTTNLTQRKVYTFEVHKNANKDQITHAVEELYGVQVADIKSMIRKGKEKRVGRRMTPKQMPDRKIVYLTIKKGTIDLFPQS